MVTRCLFGRDLDYRWVILGLLAPDLIDKPVGRILLHRRFQSGRLIGHSLLLALGMVWVSVTRPAKNLFNPSCKMVIEAVAGLLVHLGMDWIWADSAVALWPATGKFPVRPVNGRWWRAFVPGIKGGKAAEELLGLAALMWVYRNSTLKRDPGQFTSTGRLFD